MYEQQAFIYIRTLFAQSSFSSILTPIVTSNLLEHSHFLFVILFKEIAIGGENVVRRKTETSEFALVRKGDSSKPKLI